MVGVSVTTDETRRTNGAPAPDDEPEPVGEPEYAPPRLSSTAAVVATLLVTALLASSLLLAAVPAGFGAAVLAIGLLRGQREWITTGVAVLFVALLLAGADSGQPAPLLLGAIGIAIAYDAGHYAIGLGEQLRADAPTARAELVHVGATTTVASATGGLGALFFRVGSGGQPSTALIALLLATILLVWALFR